MLDLSLLTTPVTWWIISVFIFSFFLIYATGDIVLSAIPLVTITVYMSITGLLPLWYAWLILLVLSAGFAVLVVLPVVKHLSGGAGGG